MKKNTTTKIGMNKKIHMSLNMVLLIMSLNMNPSKNKFYELKYEIILKRIMYERKYGF